MANNYTENALSALKRARTSAEELNHGFIGSEHILLGLIRSEGAASAVLSEFGMTASIALPYIDTIVGSGRHRFTDSSGYTMAAKRILELSLYEAKASRDKVIGSKHILLALLREKECFGARILNYVGADTEGMRKMLSSSSALSELMEKRKKVRNESLAEQRAKENGVQGTEENDRKWVEENSTQRTIGNDRQDAEGNSRGLVEENSAQRAIGNSAQDIEENRRQDAIENGEQGAKDIDEYSRNPGDRKSGASVCIFNKSDPQEVLASWLFAQYLLTNEVQIAYSETEGYIPVTLRAQNAEEYLDYLSRGGEDNEKHYEVKIKAAQLLIDHIDNTFVTPVFNGSASLRDAAGQLIETTVKSVRRGETVDEAYMEQLYGDVLSLYRLGQQGLGPLPKPAVILLVSLAAVWVCILFYIGWQAWKRKRMEENWKKH